VAGSAMPNAALINESAPRREIIPDWISPVMSISLDKFCPQLANGWAYDILTLI
jgi:hypothetical protein